MVSVKPPKPFKEWITCNYKTTPLLHKICLMRTLQNHSSTRGNMSNMEINGLRPNKSTSVPTPKNKITGSLI